MVFGLFRRGENVLRKRAETSVDETPGGAKKTPLTLVASSTIAAAEEAPTNLAAFLTMREEMLLLARRRASHLENPDVYPGEFKSVREFLGRVRDIWKNNENVGYAKYLSRLAYSYIHRFKGMQGVDDFISNNLDVLISDILAGRVEDFDKKQSIKQGDNALALLAQCGASLRVVEKLTPSIERKEYNIGDKEIDLKKGVVLFVCGYGAPLRLYEKIFALMNRPIVAYQLPHHVISPNPQSVREAFDEVYHKIVNDPHLDKVTHVVGNSTGTMFASKLALSLSKKDRREKGAEARKSIKLALIQTGTSWPEAMKRATGKFARQVRDVMKNKKISWEDFAEATKGYNPIDLADDLGKLIAEGQLDLSLFAGLDDKNISPARAVINPLLKKLDSLGVSYNAFLSDKAGHQSAVLFFLWLSIQKKTEWGHIFGDSDVGEERGREKAGKYHVRRFAGDPATA